MTKPIRATIGQFLRTPTHNKSLSIISDQANTYKLLGHLLKASYCKKPISNEQLRKLFDLSEL